MTVEECATLILEKIAPLVLVERDDGKRQEGHTWLVATLQALIRTEKEHCAAILTEAIETLEDRRDDILRTSPDKGSYRDAVGCFSPPEDFAKPEENIRRMRDGTSLGKGGG